MPKTYESIATNTLGAAAATVTFSSIPGTYTDLVLVMATTGTTSSGRDIVIQFNGDTASNYSFTALYGDGSAAGSTRGSSATSANLDYYGYMDNSLSNRIISIQNYSNTTTYKTFIGRANNAATGTDAVVGLWRSTSAITSLLVKPASIGNEFASGSTFTLYGIKSF
jgi:hypothetical protein